MKYYVGILSVIVLCFSIGSEEPPVKSKDTVRGIEEKAAPVKGEYQLNVSLMNPVYAVKGVKAIVYVPALQQGRSSMEMPILVWYHGSSRDDSAYKTFAAEWKIRADKNGFILVSIQNWWPLSGDNTGGALDSAAASHAIISRMMDLKWTDGSRVFVTGFSAGGLTAFATFLRNIPDPYMPDEYKPRFYYRGFGVFKGNFYQDPVLDPPIASSDPEKSPAIKDHMSTRLAWLCVGGDSDAPRVKAQMPELRKYISKYFFTEPVYQVYPREGHILSDINFQDFWKSLQMTLK